MKKLSRTELVKMFRFGANAILKMGDSFENFLRAPVQEILEKASAPPAEETVEEGRGTDDSAATAGSSSSVLSSSHNVTLETNAGYTEMEDKSSASISSLLFEGKNHMKQRKSTGSYRDIASEWKEMSKRTGKDRVVIIDGMPVLKESIGNGEAWTAIPTFTGSASAVAERENGGGAGVKRKRRLIHNQDVSTLARQKKSALRLKTHSSYHSFIVLHDLRR